MSAQPVTVNKTKRSSSVCYPFSDRHLRRHSEKMVDGSYRVVEFTDQLTKIHNVRKQRQEARRASAVDVISEFPELVSNDSDSSSAPTMISMDDSSNVLSLKRRSLPNLTPLEVPAIQEDVKKGSSWFFY